MHSLSIFQAKKYIIPDFYKYKIIDNYTETNQLILELKLIDTDNNIKMHLDNFN